MRLYFVLLLVLAIGILHATDGKKVCHKYRVCAKSKQVCSQEHQQKTERCRVYGKRKVQKTQKQCIDFDVTVVNAQNCIPCKKYGDVKIWAVEQYCKEYQTTNVCTKFENKCVAYKYETKCFQKTGRYKVVGPTTCPASETLFFKPVGKSELKRYCAKTPDGVSTKTCSAVLDPHFTSPSGAHFDFQYAGDFKYLATSDKAFEVHVRLQRFAPTWTGAVAVAVLVGGVDVVEYDVGGKFKVNGQVANITGNGAAYNIPHGGAIKFTQGNWSPAQVEIFGSNGAHLLYQDYGKQYGNVYIYIPSYLNYTGVCSGQDLAKWANRSRASGLFNVTYVEQNVAKADKTPEYSQRQQDNAKARCQAAGLTAAQLERCIFDVLNTPAGHKGDLVNIEKDVTKNRSKGALSKKPSKASRKPISPVHKKKSSGGSVKCVAPKKTAPAKKHPAKPIKAHPVKAHPVKAHPVKAHPVKPKKVTPVNHVPVHNTPASDEGHPTVHQPTPAGGATHPSGGAAAHHKKHHHHHKHHHKHHHHHHGKHHHEHHHHGKHHHEHHHKHHEHHHKEHHHKAHHEHHHKKHHEHHHKEHHEHHVPKHHEVHHPKPHVGKVPFMPHHVIHPVVKRSFTPIRRFTPVEHHAARPVSRAAVAIRRSRR